MSGYRAAPFARVVDHDDTARLMFGNQPGYCYVDKPHAVAAAKIINADVAARVESARLTALDAAAAACEALMCNPDNSHEATEAFRDAADAIRKLKEQP